MNIVNAFGYFNELWSAPYNTIALTIAVLIAAGYPLIERFVTRRNRIHYRVLYNSKIGLSPVPLHDESDTDDSTSGADPRVRQVTSLVDGMSVVIIRIHNTGYFDIGPKDFELPLEFTFARRVVWDARISEASNPALRKLARNSLDFFPNESTPVSPAKPVEGKPVEGLSTVRGWLAERLRGLLDTTPRSEPAEVGPQWHGVRLTGLSLKRKEKFKLVVVLQQPDDEPAGRAVKNVEAHGRIINGWIKDEKQQPRVGRPMVAVAVCLVLIGALTTTVLSGAFGPKNEQCASGELHFEGSSAFLPAVERAHKKYQKLCGDANITTEPSGSLGVPDALKNAAPDGPQLAVASDGRLPPIEGALPQPVAVIAYGMVVNHAAGATITSLSTEELRRIYLGEIRNWKQLGGEDVPIRIVSRDEDSGTRRAFREQILEPGTGEVPRSSLGCDRADLIPGAAIRCTTGDTKALLDEVNQTPGAIGYADEPAAKEREKRDELKLVQINGKNADVDNVTKDDGGYPFWAVEYLYTRTPLEAGSLGEKFIDYLYQSDSGLVELRRAGYAPCVDRRDLCD